MADNDFSFDELLTKISDLYKDAETKVGHCNVLVIGKTGVGKSTLINAVLGGAIAASTAATLTLALGLSYIELLKRYMKAQINGETISLPNLTRMFLELYKDYIQTGRKTLPEDDSRPLREIDIE